MLIQLEIAQMTRRRCDSRPGQGGILVKRMKEFSMLFEVIMLTVLVQCEVEEGLDRQVGEELSLTLVV